MKVASVELKAETVTLQVTVGTETRTSTTVTTKFEEVRGYSNISDLGNMIVFYNAGKVGEHVYYNQNDVVGITTYTE